MRVRDSRTSWITNSYPLIDAGMRRCDCVKLLEELGLPVPKKSSCVFCPYHSDEYWAELKQDHPEEFNKAVQFDRAIRNMTKSGVRNPVYLHRSLRPLDEIDLVARTRRPLFDRGMLDECDGMCGV